MNKSAIPVSVWVKPAFSRYSPVDHTWVTSYDNRRTPYKSISEVKRSNHLYWYCHGDFHRKGGTQRVKDGYIYQKGVRRDWANCLVGVNQRKAGGTIRNYGLDGVCHQVTNQVLYAGLAKLKSDPIKDAGIRGYRASTAVYGRYGRKVDAWKQRTRRCCPPVSYNDPRMSLLRQRLVAILPTNIVLAIAQPIDDLRNRLLSDVDDIGFRDVNDVERPADRAFELNDRIIEFFLEAAEIMENYEAEYEQVFGIKRGEKIDIIDSEIFQFPEQMTRDDEG